MTKHVVTLTPSETLYDTIEIFARKGISGAPVISRGKKVVGLVHDVDITRALDLTTPGIQIADSKLFALMFAALRSKNDGDRLNEELKEARKIKVKAFMSPPVTINKNSLVEDAVREMANTNITRLAVTDDSGKLVGIIARADIIRALEKILPK